MLRGVGDKIFFLEVITVPFSKYNLKPLLIILQHVKINMQSFDIQ